MSPEEISRQYLGETVPQSYNAKFIVLSFVVSLVGASSTLELINRRTGFKGVFNHLLLVSSAITMGGVSIWCMHFIGNQAVELAHGEPQLQIAYSSSFTAVSFFVPILVLAAAFMACGSNNNVSWWRISIGGTLCGGAVCGMHYLGNASIANYTCIYQVANVVGAALIAVAASIVALSIFFIFRAIWSSSWWKRIASAVILAAAVSGMHWVAAVGTRYRLVTIEPVKSDITRKSTVIVVICLSIGACFIIAGSAIFKARNLKKHADKAQKVTLGAAIFDKHGRILVDNDGLIPSTVITDLYPEKNNEGFGISHPAFHWMFQATKNWGLISSRIAGMKSHLDQLATSGRAEDGRPRVDLTNSFGDPIDNYNVIFRELFCVAASTLAERLREQVSSVGVLWDDILPTGVSGRVLDTATDSSVKGESVSVSTNEVNDLTEKGQLPGRQIYGRGSLMFLVRSVQNSSDVDRLTSLGYRFAQLHHVASVIEARMQIQSPATETKLRQMAAYADHGEPTGPGVSVCFFGIKARVDRSGFEVVVQKGARNHLPAASLPMDNLQPWQLNFLRGYANKSVSAIVQALDGLKTAKLAPNEKAFAGIFSDTLKSLSNSIQDRFFDDASLTLDVLNLSSREQQTVWGTQLLAFRLLIPVHTVLVDPNYEFIPLSFFKVRQPSQKQHLDFAQSIHREFEPILKAALEQDGDGHRRARSMSRSNRSWWEKRADSGLGSEVALDVNHSSTRRGSSPRASVHSNSTVELYPRGGDINTLPQYPDTAGNSTHREEEVDPTQLYSGILVSQEITIDIETAGKDDGGPRQFTRTRGNGRIPRTASAEADIEMSLVGQVRTNIHAVESGGNISNRAATVIDVLFDQCVEGRY